MAEETVAIALEGRTDPRWIDDARLHRQLEVTYTSHDLAPWAADLGYTGAPFGFDPDRRAILRAELDAYYARLYGLNCCVRKICDGAAACARRSTAASS